MSATKTKYTPDEIGDMGVVAYDRYVRDKVQAEDIRKFVAIDVLTGEYEIDKDAYSAVMRLRDRMPDAEVWLTRVGQRYVFKLRPRYRFIMKTELDGLI